MDYRNAGNMSNQNVPMTDAPVSSPVRDAISGGEEFISTLNAAVDRLERRLDTILTPTPPQTSGSGGSGASPTPLMSPVQARLRMANDAWAVLANRLNTLHDRIEL